MAEGAHYSIGPLTTYADPGELQEWFRGAQPGHECKYAAGPALGKNAPTAALARKLAGTGGAELFQRRNGKGFDYLIRRKAAPDALVELQQIGPAERRVLEVLSAAAEGGQARPTYEEIAETAGLPDWQAARYRMKILQRAGVIAVDRDTGAVTIVAIGKTTGGHPRKTAGAFHG